MKYRLPTLQELKEEYLDRIHEAGFEPVAYCDLLTYPTFIFRTETEAVVAYKVLEKNSDKPIVAFWYGPKGFMEYVHQYEAQFNTILLVRELCDFHADNSELRYLKSKFYNGS